MRTLFDTNRQDSRFGPRSDPSKARARTRDGPSQIEAAFGTHAVRPQGEERSDESIMVGAPVLIDGPQVRSSRLVV